MAIGLTIFVLIAEVAITAWAIRVTLNDRKRRQANLCDLNQEFAHLRHSQQMFARACDNRLTHDDAMSLLVELHIAQIMLEQRRISPVH